MNVSLLVALWLGVAVQPAPAGSEASGDPIAGLDLAWDAPAGCPDAAGLRARIRAILAAEGSPDPETFPQVRADVSPEGDALQLELAIETTEGVEATTAGSAECEVLTDLVALKVALALNPADVRPQPGPEAVAEPPAPATPAPAPPAPTPPTRPARPSPAAAARTPPGLVVLVGGDAGLGLLPTVDLGARAGVGLEGAGWRTAVSTRFLASPAVRTAALDPGGVRVLYVGAMVEGCYVAARRRTLVPLCATAEGGGMRARGFDLPMVSASWRPAVALGFETGVAWPSDARVRFTARAGASAVLLRPVFQVAGAGEIHRTAPVAGRILVGLEWVPGARRNGSRAVTSWTTRSPT